MSKLFKLIFTSCLLLFTIHCSLFTIHAQSSTATLSGTIQDENGAVIPGAAIAVVNEATSLKRTAATNESGSFSIPLLPPGEYTVLVEREGFTRVQLTNIVLNVGDQKAVQVQLKVGDVASTVEVRPDESLVDTTASVHTTIDRTFVGNLPLNGRSFQSLIALSPGVVLTKAAGSERGQFSVNGQRANANQFLIDGVSGNIDMTPGIGGGQRAGGSLPALSATGGTNTLVTVDALQEFQIQTSSFAPEFGRMPGAQILIATRSGTNNFSGTVFEYFRNEALDANDWFANRAGIARPALRQNDFGGVFGGPIIKDRTHFFFSYEGLRLRLPQVGITEVPSLAARSSAPAAVRPLLDAFPLPNGGPTSAGFARFTAGYSDSSELDATSIRIDHKANDRLTFFGRYNHAPSSLLTRGVAGVAAVSLSQLTRSEFRTQTLTLGSTFVVNSRATNDVRFNYSANDAAGVFELDNFGGAQPPSSAAFLPSFATIEESRFGLFVQRSAFSVGRNADNRQRQFNVVDNFFFTKGDHQLKFGVDYRWVSPLAGPAAYALDIEGTLAGTADSVSIASREEAIALLYQQFSAYGQDTWSVNPRLTLTYGLRWEVSTPPKGRDGKDIFTVTGVETPSSIALAPPGTPFWKTSYTNFAPRFGVAYQLFRQKGWETLVRGGVGMFYDLGTGVSAGSADLFPYTRSRTVSPTPSQYPVLDPTVAAPAPFSTNPPVGSIMAFDPELSLPRTYQWNLAVQQSLGSDQSVSATYVGAVGRRLLRLERLVNPAPGFASVSLTRNTGTSDYHAMQLQFRRRFAKGFQALASYTWSHSIDVVSGDSFATAPASRIDLDRERGSSDFDVRHSFSSALTYATPKPSLHRWVDPILSDWFVDAIFVARSATPVDVFSNRNIGFGSFAFRPNVIPGVALYLENEDFPGGRRINNTPYTAADNAMLLAAGCLRVARGPSDPVGTPTGAAKGAFCTPASGQGNLGRNSLRGFNVWQLDLAVRREIPLSERMRLQLRVEFFNLLNHPNFADPVGNLTNGFFGQSTQMLGRSLGSASGGLNPIYQVGGPRSIQLAARFSF